jgi:hypothetical protein
MKTIKNISPKNADIMPYINFDSPELKKEFQRMDDIIRNLKQPLPFPTKESQKSTKK